jgi:predicted PurR-regulated permease PerM
MRREQLFAAFFFLAFCFLLYQFYRILYDFIGPLSYAALLAFVFFPIHQRLRRLLNGRDGLAATLMTTAVILLVIVPMFYLFALITRESVSLYEDVSEFVTSGRTHEIIDRVRDSRIGHWWTLLGPRLDALNVDLPEIALRGSQTVSRFLVSQAPAAAANVVKGVVNFFFTVFALFFFFRDGERMLRALRDLIPLDQAVKDMMIGRFAETLSAVVLGSLLTGVAQGVLGGIAYWVLDAPFAILLAGATAFLSLLPFGGPVVWIGVVVYFLIESDYWRAGIMAAWGTLVISSADNLIRPLIIGGRTQIPTVFLFFGILGGLQAYGFIGMFLGPAVIAILVAFTRTFREQYSTDSQGVPVAAIPDSPQGTRKVSAEGSGVEGHP